MYSVMLAAMLTTTSATPEWGCHGCYGCCGGCVGYYGYNAFSSCRGCCGGCWGCSGCYGPVVVYGGCHGCCGGFFGSGNFLGGPYFDSFGCHGCHGGAYFSSFNCHGCSGCHGAVVASPPVIAKPRVMTFSIEGLELKTGPEVKAASSAIEQRLKALEEENRALRERLRSLDGGKPGKPAKPRKPDEVSAPAPAHVIVKLPEEARLFVDETPCPLTSATRSFDTPALDPGQEYYYTLTAEVMRDGRAVTATRKVTVRAGEESVVEFGAMRSVLSASR